MFLLLFFVFLQTVFFKDFQQNLAGFDVLEQF